MNRQRLKLIHCRLFGHEWRDTITGWSKPHFIIPTVEGPTQTRHYRCERCGAESRA